MTKRLRSALIWLLIMTLPAQSLAATAMQLCALASPSEAISAAAHPPHASAAKAHAVDTDAQAPHESHTGGATGHSTSGSDHSLCSLCAFCVGAVALSSVFSSHSLQPTTEPSLLRLEQFVGFIADTPKRPPRFFLA